jgi:hypothetical protein
MDAVVLARIARPLIIIPAATSIVRVIGSPEAEPAPPRAPIAGHVVCLEPLHPPAGPGHGAGP